MHLPHGGKTGPWYRGLVWFLNHPFQHPEAFKMFTHSWLVLPEFIRCLAGHKGEPFASSSDIVLLMDFYFLSIVIKSFLVWRLVLKGFLSFFLVLFQEKLVMHGLDLATFSSVNLGLGWDSFDFILKVIPVTFVVFLETVFVAWILDYLCIFIGLVKLFVSMSGSFLFLGQISTSVNSSLLVLRFAAVAVETHQHSEAFLSLYLIALWLTLSSCSSEIVGTNI